MTRKLVDDPFNPGHRVSEAMANVWPGERLRRSVAARFERLSTPEAEAAADKAHAELRTSAGKAMARDGGLTSGFLGENDA